MNFSPLLNEAQQLRNVGVWNLILQAALVGSGTGLVIGSFRWLYDWLSPQLIHYLHSVDIWSWPYAVGIGAVLLAMGIFAGLMVRWEPLLSGSGIPQVELTIAGRATLPWHRVLVGKFVATLDSLAAGLSVGREGPCIQMGAAVGCGLGRLWGKEGRPRFLIGGSVAGLSAAFGAPTAAMLFAFEEMKSIFSAPLVLFTAVAGLSAWGVVDGLMGFGLVFPFAGIPSLHWQQLWLCAGVGLCMGLMGALYNSVLMGMVYTLDKMKWLPTVVRAVLPFIASGVFIYYYPAVISGMGPDTAAIAAGQVAGTALFVLFGVKFLFSAGSFASGVSGGLLMPVLVMGSLGGACCAGWLIDQSFIGVEQRSVILTMGMVGYFAGSVRAPLTGAMLVTEMCGAWQCLPEILLTSIVATYVANLIGSVPVYDRLRKRIWRGMRAKAKAARKAAAIAKKHKKVQTVTSSE